MTDEAHEPVHSVTRRDEVPDPGVWQWVMMDSNPAQQPRPGLPPHWSLRRDVILAATPFLSDYWASALTTAINQIVVRPFTVTDSEDSVRRLERSQGMLLDFGGPAMYSESLSKVAEDYFTTDKGGVIEIEHEGMTRSGEPTGRPVALHHLDTLRCWPTGNREHPLVYVDWQGQYHKLHAKSVMTLVDSPSPRLGLWGVGRCAASKAWGTIVLDGAIQQYVTEKITGSRALALHFVGGVTRKQLLQARASADEEQAQAGAQLFKGALVIPVALDPGTELKVATVDLAAIPDGFDPAQIQQRAALVFALALGMPYTDIMTLQGGQFGTGTQSQVIDESRKGRGVELFVRIFERKLNRRVTPRRTTVDLFGMDVRDQQAQAAVKKAEADYVTKLVTAGVASPDQAANYLADNQLWPQEFAQPDATEGGSLTDAGLGSKIAVDDPGSDDSPSLLATLAAGLRDAAKAAKARRLRREDLAITPDLLRRAAQYREEAAS